MKPRERVVTKYLMSKEADAAVENEAELTAVVLRTLVANRTHWDWLHDFPDDKLALLARRVAANIWKEHQKSQRRMQRVKITLRPLLAREAELFVANLSRAHASLMAE